MAVKTTTETSTGPRGGKRPPGPSTRVETGYAGRGRRRVRRTETVRSSAEGTTRVAEEESAPVTRTVDLSRTAPTGPSALGKLGNIAAPALLATMIVTYRDVRKTKSAYGRAQLPPPGQYVSVVMIYGALALLPDAASGFAAVTAWGFTIAALLTLWPNKVGNAVSSALWPGGKTSSAAPTQGAAPAQTPWPSNWGVLGNYTAGSPIAGGTGYYSGMGTTA